MKQFVKKSLEYLCAFNRFAIVILAGLGTDAIADKYNFPWQILAFIVVGLTVYDYNFSKEKREQLLRYKIDKFIDVNRSSLSYSQIRDIQQLYK